MPRPLFITLSARPCRCQRSFLPDPLIDTVDCSMVQSPFQGIATANAENSFVRDDHHILEPKVSMIENYPAPTIPEFMSKVATLFPHIISPSMGILGIQ